MASRPQDWERTQADVESIDWLGQTTLLRDVPARRNKETGAVLVNVDDMIKTRHRLWLSEMGVEEPRDFLTLLILYARPGWFRGGEVSNKFKLNKMLFYQWKKFEAEGLSDAIVHDEFICGRAGPIPGHLKDDLTRLARAGWLDVEWSAGPGTSTVTKLTAKGTQVAETLWLSSPEFIRSITQAVKDELFPLDSKTIKEWFHRRFPEYRRTYTQLDQE